VYSYYEKGLPTPTKSKLECRGGARLKTPNATSEKADERCALDDDVWTKFTIACGTVSKSSLDPFEGATLLVVLGKVVFQGIISADVACGTMQRASKLVAIPEWGSEHIEPEVVM